METIQSHTYKTYILTNWSEMMKYFKPEQRDVYFQYEYIKLYETHQQKPTCFVYQEGNNTLLMPYLCREISFLDHTYYDLETAYGYGGTITNTNDYSFTQRAIKTFFQSHKEKQFIAGFIRFHPLLKNFNIFKKYAQVEFDRKTVAINLQLTEEEIWTTQLHSKHRNVIRKAMEHKLEFVVDHNLDYMDAFIELYYATMKKVKASEFYFFDNKCFNNLKDSLKKNTFLGLVFSGKKLISAALFFYNKIYGHYHLSGNNNNYLSLYPNNFLLYKTACYLKNIGCKEFHLGGGTNSDPHNSLLKFKQRFSKNMYDFHIGKVIFNPTIYQKICKQWEKDNPTKREKFNHYFLKYNY